MRKYIHSRTRIRTPLYKRYTVAYSRAYASVCLFVSVYINARSFFLQKMQKPSVNLLSLVLNFVLYFLLIGDNLTNLQTIFAKSDHFHQ